MLSEMLGYSFMVRALIAGVCLTLSCSLLGVDLVLKRCAMIGDSLSHVAFAALAVSVAAGFMPTVFAFVTVSVCSFLLLKSTGGKAAPEASTALISSASLAVGVMAVSISGGVNIDVYNYLFGSILAVSRRDVILCVILALLCTLYHLLYSHRIFSVCYDEPFAKATGVKTSFFNTLSALFTSLVIVAGMKIMGSLMISALIIFPPLCAMKLCSTFRGVMLTSCAVGVVGYVLALIFSYGFSTPTGASTVCFYAVGYLCFSMGTGRGKG